MRNKKTLKFYTLIAAIEEILHDDDPETFSDYIEGLMPSSATIKETAFIQAVFNRFRDDGFCYNDPAKAFSKLVVWFQESWEQIKLLGSSIPTDYFAPAEDTSTTAISEHPQSTDFSLAPSASSDKMSNLAQTRQERQVVMPYERIQTLKDQPIAWWDVYFREYERRFVCNNTEEYL